MITYHTLQAATLLISYGTTIVMTLLGQKQPRIPSYMEEIK